ncbi:MAG TPA: CsgG/HfaB family protein [Burkholderiaceae bacterium]|jgi:hypothetical protein
MFSAVFNHDLSILRPRSALLVCLALTNCHGAHAEDEVPTVEKCSAELGTLAVAEPQSQYLAGLSRYNLGSPSIMLRMIAQESGCFAVVERGVAMQNLQQERALAAGGQLQSDANVGGGQMQAADFVMTPAVQFSDDTGGIGGVVGGLFNRAGGLLGHLGGLAGGVKFKEAETTLLVADVRSGIQVASAEGKASKMNFSIGGWGWGGLGWASAGGYSKTPEGKLIAASLLDNFNKIVLAVRDKPSLIRNSVQASTNNAANAAQATGAARRPALAAPVVVARSGPLPATMIGAFSGQYSGADQGIFSVTIEADGQISGVGQSAANVAFNITGTASAGGTLTMTSSGQAGSAQFNGIISPNSGAVVGTWRVANGNKGVFNGKRQ